MSNRLIVLATELGDVTSLQGLLESRGLTTTLCPTNEDMLAANPCAIILASTNPFDGVIKTVQDIRHAGFSESICVLGFSSPELTHRQQLSAVHAWFIPAFDSDSAIAARLLQIVC